MYFFELNNKTTLSFETAIKKLSGDVVTFNKSTSSIKKKGESDIYTMKNMEQYGDVIVL